VFPFRDDQAFELKEMIHQVHFRRGLHWPEHDGATLGLQDGKGAAIAKAAFFPDVLRDHYLAFLRHMDDCHGRKLLLSIAAGKANSLCRKQPVRWSLTIPVACMWA
jgi:hypothetical protein